MSGISDQLQEYMLDIFEARLGNDSEPDLCTGIPKLDKVLGVIQPGLYSIIGQPGAGKTALALQIGREAALGGYPVIYMTFSETPELLYLRNLSTLTNTNASQYLHGYKHPDDLLSFENNTTYRRAIKWLEFKRPSKALCPVGISELLEQTNKVYGAVPCLFVIDFYQAWLGHLKSRVSDCDPYTTLYRIQDIALRSEVPFLILSTEETNNPLQAISDVVMRVKGGIYTNTGSRYSTIAIEKHRYGKTDKVDLFLENGSFVDRK